MKKIQDRVKALEGKVNACDQSEDELPECLREMIVDIVSSVDEQPPTEVQIAERKAFIHGPYSREAHRKLFTGLPPLPEEEQARRDKIYKEHGKAGLLEYLLDLPTPSRKEAHRKYADVAAAGILE